VPLQAWHWLVFAQTRQLGSGQAKQLPLNRVTTVALPLKEVEFWHWLQKLGLEHELQRLFVQFRMQDPLVRTYPVAQRPH
jgi:hypothetical protein